MTPEQEQQRASLEQEVAQAFCGFDLDWRDCSSACLAAGKCVGEMNGIDRGRARAAIAIVVRRCAEVAEREGADPPVGSVEYIDGWSEGSATVEFAIRALASES